MPLTHALGMKEHTARHWVPRLIAVFWRCTAAIATRAAVKLPQRRKRPTESGLFLRQRPNSVGSALTPRTVFALHTSPQPIMSAFF